MQELEEPNDNIGRFYSRGKAYQPGRFIDIIQRQKIKMFQKCRKYSTTARINIDIQKQEVSKNTRKIDEWVKRPAVE